ncbi:MAG TPA: type II toxin-antitoxin system Phd/YefM family antitoxin [Candidatus Baltobacteraceae bacterium]|nr:type II toxin-antitoxin system Phd/YefM family antitoxin [Candidatus Baltobacteraceae bacterium]
MKSVGIFDAKTRLSELVAEAEKGERITITRNGIPAAVLIPVEAEEARLQRARRIYASIRRRAEEVAQRNGGGIPWEEVKAWIDEGRP